MHIVSITRFKIVIWIFYMDIKFREDLFSRVFNFAINYKDPRN